MRTRSLLFAACCLAAVPAQKLPLADGSGRVLQLLDAGPLLDALGPEARPKRLDELATFLKSCLPTRNADDDVRGIGPRSLVLLMQPEQAAVIESMLAAAIRPTNLAIDVRISFLEMATPSFARQVEPLLAATPDAAGPAGPQQRQRVFGRERSKEVAAALAELEGSTEGLVVAPRLSVKPLQSASLTTGETISYIRDFELTRQEDGATIANPLLDSIFDGIKVELTCAYVGERSIAIACSMLLQKVTKPIPEYRTELRPGTPPVTVQLPQAQGIRMQQSVTLEDGGLVVIAAPKKSEASWVVAILRAETRR